MLSSDTKKAIIGAVIAVAIPGAGWAVLYVYDAYYQDVHWDADQPVLAGHVRTQAIVVTNGSCRSVGNITVIFPIKSPRGPDSIALPGRGAATTQPGKNKDIFINADASVETEIWQVLDNGWVEIHAPHKGELKGKCSFYVRATSQVKNAGRIAVRRAQVRFSGGGPIPKADSAERVRRELQRDRVTASVVGIVVLILIILLARARWYRLFMRRKWAAYSKDYQKAAEGDRLGKELRALLRRAKEGETPSPDEDTSTGMIAGESSQESEALDGSAKTDPKDIGHPQGPTTLSTP